MATGGLLVLATASAVSGMQAAELSGTVTDATGLALPGVNVEARPAAGDGPVRTAVTDGSGAFTFTALDPGVCDVTLALAGFTPWGLSGGYYYARLNYGWGG